MRHSVFVIVFLLFGFTASAQSYQNVVRHRPVFWSEMNLVFKTKGKWSFQLDHQYRRQAEDTQFRDLNIFRLPLQQVFRPWISYQLTKPVRLSLSPIGLWWTWNRPSEFQPTTFFQEIRVIPQLTITKPAGDGELVYRFRSELRWPSRTDTLANEYVFLSDGESQQVLADRFNVRLRAMLRWIKPIRGKESGWYVQSSVEPMMVVSRSVRRFDQNRTYLAIGRRLRENMRVELGYLNQFSIQNNEVERIRTFRFNHALHVYFYLENRRTSKASSDSGPE
ncbi:DUF2490 domain-containing protein [Spirosoma montaniterrae]|uniref:DUF2490 domain-containing protein n=1 Tax=Spirosoma montaniterrae TaxID=1178516 RepID=A0A1P9WWG9_9BACT|nr:DUF2490 domain-containing protein [Spirosoma montaniterrae]AQG79737.1 hypothetical protein AWR27_10605 [Spirosoma montaniterrae]